jgi:tetratricopeptide (TPR) repeat protein
MFFNNDDDDDNEEFGGNFKPLNEILNEFARAKRGETNIQLEEEDYEFLIDFYESENDKENVKIACDLGTTFYPYSIALLMRKCEWLSDQNKFGQALKVLDSIDLIEAHNLEALFMRMDIWVEMGKLEEAIKLLLDAVLYFDDDEKVDIYLELSELYDQLEDFEKVYDSLKQILVYEPQNEEAMLRICFWADITNQQNDAIGLYQKILDENPFNTLAWYNMGVAMQGVKLYEKSIECYTNCIDLDEQFEYAYRNLGDAYIQLKQYDNAIDALEKHLKYSTPEDIILEAIGDCWERKKQYNLARTYYRKAIQMSPEDDSIFYKIGKTYVREAQWEKAIKSYQTAYELNSTSSTYCIALGNCLMAIEAVKEALVCFLNAVRLKPNSKTPWLALIKALYATEYYEEALTQLQIAEDLCGIKAEFAYNKVVVLLAIGKTKDALLNLENAIMLWPKKINTLKLLDKDILHHPAIVPVVARVKKKR